jgi:hypothetical protein
MSYKITIMIQPEHQTCIVENGEGIALKDIENINIICSWNLYAVGGVINHLLTNLTIMNNQDQENAILIMNDIFVFTELHLYDIEVLIFPMNQICEVINGKGIALGHVSDVTGK